MTDIGLDEHFRIHDLGMQGISLLPFHAAGTGFQHFAGVLFVLLFSLTCCSAAFSGKEGHRGSIIQDRGGG